MPSREAAWHAHAEAYGGRGTVDAWAGDNSDEDLGGAVTMAGMTFEDLPPQGQQDSAHGPPRRR